MRLGPHRSRLRSRRSRHRPFAVGGGEGGGGAESGVTGWLMAEQSQLTHLIAAKVHALHGQPSAAWGLIGLGLAYGVVHAAGPGHGKAILASYMLANERALKRGAVMALLAALLQALLAIGLVATAGFVFNATASQMNRAADWVTLASYCERRRHRPVAGLAQGPSAHRGFEPAFRSRPGDSLRPRLCRHRLAQAGVQPVGGGLSRRARLAASRRGRRHAATRMPPIPLSSMERSPGATRPER